MKLFPKIISVILVATFLLLGVVNEAKAETKSAGSSATLAMINGSKAQDERVVALKKYLELYDSPLAPYAGTFVENADKYNLDWRLVASISGLESGFGKQIPYDSYNAWGWGIYGTHVLRFNSWDEAITTISKGLRENYLRDKVESDPYFIGPTYAASPTWAVRVAYFMQRIGNYKLDNEKEVLSISI